MKRSRPTFVFCLSLFSLLPVCFAAAEEGARAGKGPEKKEESTIPRFVPRHFLRTGGRRIESGLRIESTADRVRVAQKFLPQGGEPRGMPLPQHLGGGFLFFQPVAVDGATYTAFYRARTWTGDLLPLGRIPFAVQHVAFGFDRVYALGVSLQAAFDPDSGRVLPLAPLPPLATISGLAFVGPRRAIVSGPLVGVLYTPNAGLTWERVEGAESIEVDLTGKHLFVRTSQGLSLVNDEGATVLLSSADLDERALRTLSFERVLEGHVGSDAVEVDDVSRSARHPAAPGLASRDLLERKWIAVLTRGAPYKGAALAIEGGELLRLGLDDGLELSARPSQVAPTATCIATADEAEKDSSPLFLCRGKTLQAYRLLRDAAWEEEGVKTDLALVWEGKSESEVLTWGSGGALLSGDCRGGNKEAQACHLSASGARSLHLPPQQGQKSRAYASTSHLAEALWFDRETDAIKRAVLSAPNQPQKKIHSWKLPADHAIFELLREGALLRRASVTKEGLNFWATHREKFVGVLLGDGAKPSFGVVQRPLRRAIFDGPRAILWGAAGFAKQSVDGGQTFEELSLPYRSGDAELPFVDHPHSAVTMGCSAVGCSLGRLLKIGWSLPQQTEEKLPLARPFPVSGSTRFRFTCGAPKSSPPRRAAGEGSFPGFWEKSPPALLGGDEGYSLPFPGDLARFYVWGPADSSWNRAGRSQVMFVNPWDGLAVRTSAPTLQLFASATDAKSHLGLDDPTSGFRFLSMDPDGRSGVMIFRGAASTDLFAFEEGQPLEHIRGAHELGHRNLAGAVRSRSSFVVAFVQGPVLSLVQLSGGTVHPFADFNLGNQGQRGVQLVRTHRGDLGLALEGDDGLFVYPVSYQGELGEPIFVSHESGTPAACTPEATGFIIDRELAVSPYLETTTSRTISVSRVRAKMIIGYGKICIDSLRAEARDLGELDGAPAPGASILLTVLDADSDGRRSQLVCE